MKAKKKINIPMILLLLYMFVFILFFIVLAITSKDDLVENMEVDRIRRDIFRLLNKDTEVYVEGVKLEGKEREKVLRIFNGEDVGGLPFSPLYYPREMQGRQEVKVKLKKEDKEMEVRIFINFYCSDKNPTRAYLDSEGKDCELEGVLKVNYQGKEKSMIVHVYDESEEVLKKYAKKYSMN